MRKSNFPDQFQNSLTFLKIPNFPDQLQNSLTFPWPWISLTFPWPLATLMLPLLRMISCVSLPREFPASKKYDRKWLLKIRSIRRVISFSLSVSWKQTTRSVINIMGHRLVAGCESAATLNRLHWFSSTGWFVPKVIQQEPWSFFYIYMKINKTASIKNMFNQKKPDEWNRYRRENKQRRIDRNGKTDRGTGWKSKRTGFLYFTKVLPKGRAANKQGQHNVLSSACVCGGGEIG